MNDIWDEYSLRKEQLHELVEGVKEHATFLRSTRDFWAKVNPSYYDGLDRWIEVAEELHFFIDSLAEDTLELLEPWRQDLLSEDDPEVIDVTERWNVCHTGLCKFLLVLHTANEVMLQSVRDREANQ